LASFALRRSSGKAGDWAGFGAELDAVREALEEMGRGAQ
jgi:hypothetical protein